MIRAFIFDMDGVLVDTEPQHLEATNQLLAGHGVRLSPSQNQVYLGWTEEAFWKDVIRRFGLPGSPAEYGQDRRARFLALLQNGAPPIPGVVEFLARLSSLDLRLGLASSSDESVIRYILDALGVTDRFDAITAGDQVHRSKPEPEIFLNCAARLGVDPSNCLVFEDSPHGIKAAHRAGMSTVRVLTETTRKVECEPSNLTIENFVGLDPRMLLDVGRKTGSRHPGGAS